MTPVCGEGRGSRTHGNQSSKISALPTELPDACQHYTPPVLNPGSSSLMNSRQAKWYIYLMWKCIQQSPLKETYTSNIKEGDLLQKIVKLLSDKRVIAALGVLVLAVIESTATIES